MAVIIGHTTRAPGTILTAAIYNQDHQVHIANAYALNEDVNLQNAIAVGIMIDGAGFPPDLGPRGDVPVPFACDLLGAYAVADQEGDAVIDIWAAPFGDFPPDGSASITGATPLTISSSDKAADEAMTDWTKSLDVNTVLRWSLTSVSIITRMTVWLSVRRKAS